MGSSIETAGPYTLHVAAVLWIIAIVVILVQRRRARKSQLRHIREYLRDDLEMTKTLFNGKK